jgi:AraC family transcriptional regulator, regulatory protein of adaptative response / methylated-DNA-[protein]-cysteine methyltransferase
MLSKSEEIKIEWGISSSPFGNTLIASSSNGIIHLSFFETNETDCYQQLIHDWPSATLDRNDRLAAKLSRQIFQSSSTEKPKLAPKGTEFQLQVWKALLKIPRGKTATYSEIAKLIGKPKASRAVGNAIGKNPIAYLIPCHRVIRTDGSLGGFRWGTNCKTKLLAQEWTA